MYFKKSRLPQTDYDSFADSNFMVAGLYTAGLLKHFQMDY